MSMTYYTKDHEWVRVEGESVVVGITHYAQEQLGDVVFVDLPEVGSRFERGSDVAVVESVKAASEIYAPVSGEILAINDALSADPSLVNRDCENEGWFFKMRLSDGAELDDLLDSESYASLISAEGS